MDGEATMMQATLGRSSGREMLQGPYMHYEVKLHCHRTASLTYRSASEVMTFEISARFCPRHGVLAFTSRNDVTRCSVISRRHVGGGSRRLRFRGGRSLAFLFYSRMLSFLALIIHN